MTPETASAHRDVASLEAEVERLRAMVTELREFVSVVTHDLQEPLRSITGFGELLRRHGDEQPERREEYLGYMVDAAERAQQRIAGLAHYVRLGGRALDVRPTELGPLVEAAVDATADEVAAAGGTVLVDGDLPTIAADATLLGEVVRELIANAARFRHPERPLRIVVRPGADGTGPEGARPDGARIDAAGTDGTVAEPPGPTFTLVVEDNGIGVPAEHHHRVVGLFERLHNRSEYPGHGFGLAVAQRVAHRHGGWMHLDDGPDGGLAVSLTLPVEGPPERGR